MPGPLEATLFGEVSFRFGGVDITPRSRKLTALMVLLTLTPGGVRRQTLAEFIWPPGKLASLRQALYELRRLPGAGSWLQDGDDVVRLSVDSDAAAFERALQRGDSAAAVALATADLVADQPELDAPAYQEWLADHRRRVAGMRVSALVRESARLEAEGDLEAARTTVRTALALDPLDEPNYRTAMRLAYVLGDSAMATGIYHDCVRVLRHELDDVPSLETRALASLIARGESLRVHVDVTAMSGQRLRLLQALHVADGALDITGIATVLGRPVFEVAEDLAAFQRHHVVSHHLSVASSHEDAVKTSLSLAGRRLLHERTAGLLVEDPHTDPAVLARHLLAAGNAAAATPRLMVAARAAVAAGQVARAIDLLFMALWAGHDQHATRLEALLLLEGAAAQTGDKDLQSIALTQAEQVAWERQADRDIAEVRMRRSRQQLAAGNVGEGLELALEALEIAHRLRDDSLSARARNAVGGAHYFAGDLDGAASVFAANLDTADRMERYRAHSNLGSLAAMRGAFHEAYPHFESALTLARAAGPHADIAATLNNLAATAERIGEYPTAVKHFREGIELARRTGSLGHEGRMLVNLAVVFARLGELGPAWNTAAEAEDLAVQVDDPRLALSAAELQADVLRSCGMLAEAAGVMSKALDSAVAMNDERKALTLGAQLKTIEAVRGGERGPAVEAITALDDERLTDVAPWLWLELALAACDAPSATAFLGRVRRDDMSVHQRVVADIAAVRAGLLQGADGRCRVSADVAAARLQAPAPDVGSLARRPFVEKPLGTLVLAARAHAGRRQTVPSSFVVPEEVIADVKVQAEGLPRDMAERLREQPRHWLAALSGV